MNKLLKKTWGEVLKIPFKPKDKITTFGVKNMKTGLHKILTVLVLSLSLPALAATPITLEDQEKDKVEAVKVEVKKEVKKVAKKPRMETLPGGQKVKVFPGAITEMPKEVGVQYVTEAGYQKLLKEIKEAKNTKEAVPAATPIKLETVAEKSVAPVLEKTVAPEKAAEVKVEAVTPITLQPVAPVIQDSVVETKPIDVSKLPVAPTPVKAVEVADPVPMVPQHPAPVVAPVAATPIKLESTEEKSAPVAEKKEDSSIPKVTISLEQREEMKKQLREEFDKISIEEASPQLSQKVLEEQQKIEDTMEAKLQAEQAAKVKAEKEAKELQAAQDEKEYRENAPLAEDNQAQPARAYTDEELKPVRLDKKNKNLVIELPKQRLNAYLTGTPMPKLSAPVQESGKSQRLEENSDLEEVSGPNYSNY